MTLKVVQGLLGPNAKLLSNDSSQLKSQQAYSANKKINTNDIITGASAQIVTEAVVTTIKASSIGRAEKIKSYSEAEFIKDKVADKIKADREEDGVEAHAGLDYLAKSGSKREQLLS